MIKSEIQFVIIKFITLIIHNYYFADLILSHCFERKLNFFNATIIILVKRLLGIHIQLI